MACRAAAFASALIVSSFFFLSVSPAQESAPEDAEQADVDVKEFFHKIDPKIVWDDGPCSGTIGTIAKLAVPEGCIFTGKEGTRRFLLATENIPGDSTLATVHARHLPAWWACFEYENPGHVKDSDKGELDADAMLEAKKDSCKEGNQDRKRRGFSEFEISGWSVPPHYDDRTHNLEWGVRLHSTEGDTINYEVRLLSRLGFVQTTLVCSPEDFAVALPAFRELLKGFELVQGQGYDEVKAGDPIADLTLTTLVMGGAAAAAWKFGLFKYLKVIVLGVVGAVVAIWRKITGRGRVEAQPPA